MAGWAATTSGVETFVDMEELLQSRASSISSTSDKDAFRLSSSGARALGWIGKSICLSFRFRLTLSLSLSRRHSSCHSVFVSASVHGGLLQHAFRSVAGQHMRSMLFSAPVVRCTGAANNMPVDFFRSLQCTVSEFFDVHSWEPGRVPTGQHNLMQPLRGFFYQNSKEESPHHENQEQKR